LSTLWSPSSGHSTTPISTSRRITAKRCRPLHLACAPFERRIDAEALHRRPAAHRQHFAPAWVVAVDDQPAAPRHGAHQVVELALDRGHVGEDVGVVVLEVVEDRDQRAVVDELAALVEEGGVVFVGLDHEVGPAAARADTPKFLGHAADQEARRRAPCASSR
jgi:hypothetical protein